MIGVEQIALAALGLCVGTGAGWLHFRSLRAVSERLLKGDFTAIALQLARFAVLGAVLVLAALGGTITLISTAIGVMIGRQIVLRQAEAR